MEQRKKKPAGTKPAGRAKGVTVTTTTQPAQFTGTKRFKCPVHGGKNLLRCRWLH